MNLCFSIDALSASGGHAWRLLENESWRQCRYAEPLRPGDARINEKAVAEAWSGRRLKKEKDRGLLPQQKAGRFDFLMRGIFAHAVLHRFSPAPVPAKEQMVACIAALPPGTPWLVFLNVSGHFTAVDTSKTSIICNLDIAVRGEIASSPDFIGPRASQDEKMMDELYRQFLGGWLEHLKSSNMNVFVPDAEKLAPLEQQLEAIGEWRHE